MWTADLESDMKKDKFLTVMAVLDDDTQSIMAEMQKAIMSQVSEGTQTMGIPFHITLGSYPVEMENEIVKKIERVATQSERFVIEFARYNDFGERVLFLEPNMPWELLALREQFECDYAGGFEWVPHATLFCGEEKEVARAKGILSDFAMPLKSKIVAIELGEFFPPRRITRKAFK